MTFAEAGKKLGQKVVRLAKGSSDRSEEYQALPADGEQPNSVQTRKKKKNKQKTDLEGGNDSLLNQTEEPMQQKEYVQITQGTYKPV